MARGVALWLALVAAAGAGCAMLAPGSDDARVGGGGKTLVVFVHGWQGDDVTAWASFPRFLLGALRAGEPATTLVSYSHGWTCDPAADARGELVRLAGALDDAVRAQGAIDEYIVIAHSTGGLLVKQWLVQRSDLVARVSTVFFVAVPHLGSVRERPAEAAGLACVTLTDAGTGLLEELDKSYVAQAAAAGRPRTVAIVSSVRSGPERPVSDRIVTCDSALGRVAESREFSIASAELVKPRDENDEVLRFVGETILARRRPVPRALLARSPDWSTPNALAGVAPVALNTDHRILFVNAPGAGQTWQEYVRGFTTFFGQRAIPLMKIMPYPTQELSAAAIDEAAALLQTELTRGPRNTWLLCHGLGAAVCQTAVRGALSGPDAQLKLRLRRLFLFAPIFRSQEPRRLGAADAVEFRSAWITLGGNGSMKDLGATLIVAKHDPRAETGVEKSKPAQHGCIFDETWAAPGKDLDPTAEGLPRGDLYLDVANAIKGQAQ